MFFIMLKVLNDV